MGMEWNESSNYVIFNKKANNIKCQQKSLVGHKQRKIEGREIIGEPAQNRQYLLILIIIINNSHQKHQ